MKKLILSFALGIIFGTITVDTIYSEIESDHHYYANTAVITEVDKANNLVTVEDCNGNTWQFTETEDWEFADTCSMLMDSKGTQSITDDEIIQATYCSFEVFQEREREKHYE